MGINKKSKEAVLFAGILFSAFVFGAVTVVGGDESTLVSINPATQTVSPGETFTVDVFCVPGQAIKSFEFRLSFNASLLQANSVSEGDIFDGYSTFFNDGTINNAAGTIVDIYDLIIGAGSVSNEGSLVSISFTAQPTTGSSYLTLSSVGVTNETGYVPISVSNGNVLIEVYTLTVNTVGGGTVTKNPNQATYDYNDVVTLTASTNIGWTFGAWSGDLSGNQNPKTITMTGNKVVTATFTQNAYTLTINTVGSGSVTKSPNQPTYAYNDVVTLTAVASAGWAFGAWSGDMSGSQNPKTITITGNKVVTATFADSAPPEIDNVAAATSAQLDTDPAFGWVNITVDVTDNSALDDVYLNITDPAEAISSVSMNSVDADTYYYKSSTAFSSAGNYSYFVWADDTSGNSDVSGSSTFSMPPNWDINSDGDCTVFDLVLISAHYGETSTTGWIREDVDNNGEIEVLDLVLTSNQYGVSWWT
jgi:uncharacterized repeat protein (TIGR02543 family)